MSLADEKYLSLVTFRKNGEPKPLPVWIVDLGDGRLGFTTYGESWKAKRIRNNNRVTLQPCDSRGKTQQGSAVVTGTAELTTGPEFDKVKALVREKYGFMVSMIKAMNKIRSLMGKGGDSDTAVIITLD